MTAVLLRVLATICVMAAISSCRTATISIPVNALQAQASVKTGVIEIAVVNSSDQFACLPASAFDSTQGNLTLKRKDGTAVEVKSRSSSAQKIELGFDFADSYFFLAPHERRVFHVGLENFILQDGTYDYDMLFPYFLCVDVADTQRVRDAREVSTRVLHASGKLTVDRASR